MFSRKLTHDEVVKIKHMVEFIKDKHSASEGHDYSHILEVTKFSIRIGESIPDSVDPFIIIAGALFHDIGRVIIDSGELHGLIGATCAEEYLESIGLNRELVGKITRIITTHTPTSMIPPKTAEEKIVFDADVIDRLGWIGVIRGIMGKKGTIETILEKTIKKRSKDYYKMHFEISREIAEDAHKQSDLLILGLRKVLDERIKELDKLDLPI
jgi:uncharacterized protein